MTSFKQFLYEAKVTAAPSYSPVARGEVIELLKKECSDCFWMVEHQRPLWRGDYDFHLGNDGIVSVDTTKTQRESENTSNYYTVLLDEHPGRKDFPKRSASFICTFDINVAADYGNPMAIVPFNGAKIGTVGAVDMWDTLIDLFGAEDTIAHWNEAWKKMGIKPSVKSFEEFAKRMDNEDPEAIKKFVEAMQWIMPGYAKEAAWRYTRHFMYNVWQAYSAKSTRHVAYTTASLPKNLDGEAWVGGKILMFGENAWKDVVSEVKFA